ncbi:MAG: toxin-antitoxin system YwqK family antitoxin [Myxococcota bacterium]
MVLASGCRSSPEPAAANESTPSTDPTPSWSSECDVPIPDAIEVDPRTEDEKRRLEELARWASSKELSCPPGTTAKGPLLPVYEVDEAMRTLLMPPESGSGIRSSGNVEWKPEQPDSQRCIDSAGNGRYRVAAVRDGEFSVTEAAELREGKLHGAALKWWDAEQVKARAWFDEGKPHRHWESFYSDGSPEGVLTYDYGEDHGIHTSLNADGTTHYKWTWKKGRRHGPWLTYGPSGKLELEGAYVDHRRHGPVREWWPNGEPKSSSKYCEGTRFGEQEKFHDNGKRSQWTYFRDGEREGEKLEFNEQGHVTKRTLYRRGQIVSELQEGAPRFSDFHDEPITQADGKAP